MANVHLQRQIERIADEATTSRTSVIVQMQALDPLGPFLESVAEELGRRRLAATARALMPPPRHAMAAKSRARSTPASAGPFRRTFRVEAMAESALRAAGLEALRPLLGSDWVQEVVNSYRPAKARRAREARPTPVYFWTSGSAVLELTRDELRALPKKVAGVADVFANRSVKVPPVAKASGPRGAVEDHKGYTWGVHKTGALAAWAAFGARGDGVRVAVLDTGVDPAHPDLAGKIVGFGEFDGHGRTVTTELSAAHDSGQHGTHCAATVVGSDASGRHIGMAPGAKVLAGLVLKKGVGTDAQILAGIEWAVGAGAQVISLSLGGLRLEADVLDTYTRTIISANLLGIPVVAAVGNEGSQTTASPGNDLFAFTVGATDAADRAAGFSGGRTQVVTSSRYVPPEDLPVVYSKPEVSAPGVDVYSAVPGGGWETWSGTSMATPHVAGALALLLGPPMAIAQIAGRERLDLLQGFLMATAEELGEAGQNHRYGYGRIDVLRALGYARDLGYGTTPPQKRS